MCESAAQTQAQNSRGSAVPWCSSNEVPRKGIGRRLASRARTQPGKFQNPREERVLRGTKHFMVLSFTRRGWRCPLDWIGDMEALGDCPKAMGKKPDWEVLESG